MCSATRSSASGQVGLAKPVRSADERCQQTVRVTALKVAFHPFGTEHPPVQREVFPGFKADDLLVLDFELNAALDTAEATMGLDEPIRGPAPMPATRRRVMEMGAVLRDQLCGCLRKSSHGHQLLSRGERPVAVYGRSCRGACRPTRHHTFLPHAHLAPPAARADVHI